MQALKFSSRISSEVQAVTRADRHPPSEYALREVANLTLKGPKEAEKVFQDLAVQLKSSDVLVRLKVVDCLKFLMRCGNSNTVNILKLTYLPELQRAGVFKSSTKNPDLTPRLHASLDELLRMIHVASTTGGYVAPGQAESDAAASIDPQMQYPRQPSGQQAWSREGPSPYGNAPQPAWGGTQQPPQQPSNLSSPSFKAGHPPATFSQDQGRRNSRGSGSAAGGQFQGRWGSAGFQAGAAAPPPLPGPRYTSSFLLPQSFLTPSLVYKSPHKSRNDLPTVPVVPPSNSWKEKVGDLGYSLGAGSRRSSATVVAGAADKNDATTLERASKALNQKIESWDTRNFSADTRLALTENDVQGVIDGPMIGIGRGPEGGAGRGDDTGEYEQHLVDELCSPVGLLKGSIPQDALGRFIQLAKTLDSDLISSILEEKLQETSWQVRLKALTVIGSLISSPGLGAYAEWWADNPETVKEMVSDKKAQIRSKAKEILHQLGVEIPASNNQPEAEAKRPSAYSKCPPAPSFTTDLLGDWSAVSEAVCEASATTPPASSPLDDFLTPSPVLMHTGVTAGGAPLAQNPTAGRGDPFASFSNDRNSSQRSQAGPMADVQQPYSQPFMQRLDQQTPMQMQQQHFQAAQPVAHYGAAAMMPSSGGPTPTMPPPHPHTAMGQRGSLPLSQHQSLEERERSLSDVGKNLFAQATAGDSASGFSFI